MGNWTSKPLGEVCQFINRGISPAYLDAGGVVVLNQRCVRDHKVSFDLGRRHDTAVKQVTSERFVRAGDVLVNSTGTGTLGRVAQLREDPPEPTTVDSHVTIVRPEEGLFCTEFFGYALTAIEEEIQAGGEGCGGQTELSRTRLAESYRISFPVDQNEQRRIVALLDEAFEGIAAARANADKNLLNAQELFESHREALLSSAGHGWDEAPLCDLCEIKHGYAFEGEFFAQEGDYVLLTPGNYLESGGYRDRGEKQKYFTGPIPSGYVLSEGSLLLAMTEQAAGLLGSPLLVPESDRFLHNQRLGLVVSRSGVPWVNEFFFHVFNLARVRAEIHASASGVKVRHTSPSKIGAVRVAFPTNEADQREVASKLDKLAAECGRLVMAFERKLAALDELKKSLLHQAFTGQLTSAKPTSVAAHSAPQPTTSEFTANVIGIAFARHERERREKTFGHVKAQKVLHLIEAIAKIDLGRHPIKDAAGPNDFQHMLEAEKWAKANKFFDMARRGEGYEFRKLSEFDTHLSNARKALKPFLPQLEPVIDLVVPMDTKEAEVLTTVHAAWNNLLIDGAEVTDDAIVRAAREDWHTDKLKIEEARFRTAIELIRRKGLAPDGTAKVVGGQRQLL